MNNEVKFTKLNNIIGWCVFLLAAFVYWSTVEPTVSFWDCSENIAIYYKLEVGHPPGEPFLQLLQHVISLLSFGDVHKVAPILNRACATFSAFTILFLFWTTTFFAKRLITRWGELTDGKMYAILGSGLIAATSFTFSDSFWFSATEASVWAMSGCFTSLMFWISTKYARASTNPPLGGTGGGERWLILLAFMIGLAIGVHFLCLLFIPAAVLLYFIKNYPNGFPSKRVTKILSYLTKNPRKQVGIGGFVIAIMVIGFVKAIVIPWVIGLASLFELFFVNAVGLPFNSGALIYGLVLTGLIVWGLIRTKKNNKPGWNTAILCGATMIIGYSSFILLVVRANAITPLNEDSPSDPMTLNDYLDRKQYGSWPQLYGQYYNAPAIDSKVGAAVYAKDEKKGKYVEISHVESTVYDPRFCTLFPRMYDPTQGRPRGYKMWGGTDAEKITVNEGDKTRVIDKPTWGDNFTFFRKYQVGFMYLRYLMWDFCGRQNDLQGLEPNDNLHGNWITGISAIDGLRYPQENQPDELSKNKGRNVMYGIPFLLGILGMVYQFMRDKRNWMVTATLFFFTGLAIILYLNQAPYQPRERDYSYVGSFFGFSIWIGLSVLALYEIFSKLAKTKVSSVGLAIGATAIATISPILMAHAEWDDHDRSGRYTCRDLAYDYLSSCAPNAILFTDGDCDTFPLWYAQEVEGFRTDVRVCNLELLGMAWYADQMNRKAYTSDRLPFSLTHDQYREGTRDYLTVYDDPKLSKTSFYDLKQIMDFVKSDREQDKIEMNDGKTHNYFPTHNFSIKVDKEQVLKTGTVPASLADSIVPVITWKIPENLLERNKIMVLDAIAHNDWKRPIYFASTLPGDSYMGLDQYLQAEGLALRLVPIRNTNANSIQGHRVLADTMYNNVMHKFKWGNMHSGVYLDQNIRRMASDLRIEMAGLAQALVRDNKPDSALNVLNLCNDSISKESCPYDYPETFILEGYYLAGDSLKANPLAKEIFAKVESEVKYYATLDAQNRNYYSQLIKQDASSLINIYYMAEQSKQTALADGFKTRLEDMQKKGIISLQ